jgi:hypothetical protein
MSRLFGPFLLAACVLAAQIATAGAVEEMEGASARDRVAASRGLVLVDLYAEW